jgi:hypothetical protein
MKACRGIGGIAPPILNLGARQSYVRNIPSPTRSLHAEERIPVSNEFEAFLPVFHNSYLSYLVVITTFINHAALLGA